jgi:phage tail sheath protein FI
MPFQVSPGVNVSEIDLTTVIPAVSTTEGAIAGHFRWGPVDDRVLIDSEDTLVGQYQTPNSNTANDFFVSKNFLAYGNKLYVTRVVNQGTTTTDYAKTAIMNSSNNAQTLVKNEDHYNENYSSGISGVGEFIAKYPGELGNSLRISICGSSAAWSSALTGNVVCTSNSTAVTGLNSSDFANEITVGDMIVLGPDKEVRKVKAIANSSSLTLANVYEGNSHNATAAASGHGERRWELYNYFDGSPGTSTFTSTRGGTNDEIHVAVIDEDGFWSGTANTVIERFEKVSVASDAKTEDGSINYYKEAMNRQSQYVWWSAHDTQLTNAGKMSEGVTFNASATKPQGGSFYWGRDGAAPRNADYINGYKLYSSTEEVDVSLVLLGTINQTLAVDLINNLAEVRKDCIVCLSPRRADVVNNSGYASAEMDDAIAFRDLLPSTSYAVLDSGWKYQYDKYNDLYRYVPLCGDTAGLVVQTDNTRDPWWSPAGFNRGNVKNTIKLAYNPKKAQRDQLYKKGINPVVTFPGQGTVLFGDKTMLAKPSAFDRINVRRLFIVLEKAISTAAKFTLFEFNDAFTRSQFVNLVEPFLRDVQGRRGIFDFKVVCDDTNNTGEVIDRNEFIGDIYIKPARSINFIQLNFVAVRTGVDFSEVVGQF